MSDKENTFPLYYKGFPLMRKDNIIYYGNMSDKFIIMLQILSAKDKQDIKLSDKVSIQLQLTDPDISSRDRVVKSAERDGLYNAMDIANIWLVRALSGK